MDYEDNELLFFTQKEIPFQEAKVIIYNPSIKEIGMIGERAFNIGCNFLNFSKDILDGQDKRDLENKSDFEVFMSVMNSRDKISYRTDALKVLSLLFPRYEIKIASDKIILKDLTNSDFHAEINKDNFEAFKTILQKAFCLEKQSSDKYNPADALAERIAKKFREREKKLNQMKGEKEEKKKINVYLRYASILAVGEHLPIPVVIEYTVYQLLDEFTRFYNEQEWNAYVEAKKLGAKDLDEVDNWMKDIHL